MLPWQNMTLKGALAFFLVIIAALMVFLWMLHPPTGDASQIGLLAGFVTLFIKMAADAIGYQYNSSSGSDKKDETQAKVAGALAEKVVGPAGPTAIVPWWNRLTDAERKDITDRAAANPDDAKLVGIATGPITMKPMPEDMAYLVAKGLLTQERSTEIQGA